METKYLSLRNPVQLGSWFDEWQVCWLGGWNKHRHFYLVMLVKVAIEKPFKTQPVPKQRTAKKRHKQQTPPGTRRR